MMKYIVTTVVAAAMLAASSCSGTRNLANPRLDMPEAYVAGDTAAVDSQSIADISWWEFYADEDNENSARQ